MWPRKAFLPSLIIQTVEGSLSPRTISRKRRRVKLCSQTYSNKRTCQRIETGILFYFILFCRADGNLNIHAMNINQKQTKSQLKRERKRYAELCAQPFGQEVKGGKN